MQKSYRIRFVGSAAVLALMAAMPSVAEAEAAAPAASGGENGIGDIVVTARRREESLQKVPITITALSTQDLERKTLRSTEDLKNFVPGVNISGLKRDDAFFYIRGQGPGSLVAGQRNFSSVATYFAEVPTTIAGPGVFYDLANVQVLKGPQGTLFGRNTTGGAVLFEPNRPTMKNEGYIQLQGGNYAFKQLDAVLNVAPVPDVIALRVAAEISRRDGFTQSIITKQKLDGRKYDAIRGSLLVKPFDGFENLTIVDYRSRHQSGVSEVIRAFRPATNLGGTVAANPQLAALAGLAPFAGLTSAQVLSIPLTMGGGASIGCLSAALPGCPAAFPLPAPYTSYGGVASALAAAYAGGGLALIAPTSALDQYLATQAAIGPRKNQAPELAYTKSLDIGFTNKTVYNLSDTITLKNIVAYRKSRVNNSFDFDGTPANLLTTLYVNNMAWALGSEQLTEEFQVQGRLPSLKTSYIVGYYHESEKPGFLQANPGIQVGQPTAKFFNHNDKSDAIFGHVEINPLDWIGISGGVRQTWDKRVSSISSYGANENGVSNGVCNQVDPETGIVTCPIQYKGKFRALTYDATINLKPTRGVLVYGSYRHGYKSGGFNLPAPAAPPPLPPTAYQTYKPEYVNEIELGFKADFNIGVPVRIDGAVFRDKFLNRQTAQQALFQNADGTTTAAIIILNNVKALNRGFETSVTIAPTRDLTIGGFVSYLDAHFLNTVINPATGLNGVTKGHQIANQPKWKYGINGAYTLPLGDNAGDLTLSGDWAWQSSFITDDADGAIIKTDPSYGLLNARLTWSNAMGRPIDISAFATNLLNKTYILGGFPISQLGFDSVTYGEPRMYGVSVKYSF